jgi:hypothetical protein
MKTSLRLWKHFWFIHRRYFHLYIGGGHALVEVGIGIFHRQLIFMLGILPGVAHIIWR